MGRARLRRAWIAALIAALASPPAVPPAGAQQRLYEVFGRAGGEALAIRRSPSPQSEVVGALGPQATGIAVLQRDGDWAQVRLNDRIAGWVEVRHLRPATADFALPPRLACSGTEPFWSLELSERSATFDTPDGPAERSRMTRLATSRNSHAVHAFSFGRGGRDRAVVEYTRICSDGMSDAMHDYAITLLRRDGSLLSGCCRVRWRQDDG